MESLLPALTTEDYDLGASHLSRPPLAIHALNILRTAIASFNVWFWFDGINILQGARACDLRIFFFRNYDGYGSIQILFRVLAATYLAYQVLHHFMAFVLTRREFHAHLEGSSDDPAGDDLSANSHDMGQPVLYKHRDSMNALQSTIMTWFFLVTTTVQDKDIERCRNLWAVGAL